MGSCDDCNVFQFCKFLKVFGNIIILVVVGLVGLSYYPIVVSLYGPQLVSQDEPAGERAAAFFVVILFHLFGGLMLWSYFACILTDPGRVPSDFQPDVEDESALGLATGGEASGSLGGSTSTGHGRIDKSDPRRVRYCRKCQRWKPERTHHCSICGRCVLKMDHHCVWVANCVGERNYKFFFLFLAYTLLLCGLSCLALLPYFSRFFSGSHDAEKRPADLAFSFMAFIVDIAFALSLFGFIVMHAKLIAGNTTSIEMFEKERIKPWPYDHGLKKNFMEVFGKSPLLWFVPMHGLGSGCGSEEQRRLRV